MIKRWTVDRLAKEALKYKTRSEFFEKNVGAYLSSKRKGVYEEITVHMPKKVNQSGENNSNARWTFKALRKEALKYKTKSEFQKNSPSSYLASSRRNDHSIICSHMPDKNINGENNHRFRWTDEMLQEEALKYGTRGEFQKKNPSAYRTAWKKGEDYLNKICSKMKPATNTSPPEKNIFDIVKSAYPRTQKLWDRKVKIEGRPHIKGFEIDIYVPELRKGIEFDGTYHHSFMGLKRGRPGWSDEDLIDYHKLKDQHFSSRGIPIIHIKEENWNNDRSSCMLRIEKFLEISNLTAKNTKKVA